MAAPKILSVDDSKMIHTLITKAFNPYNVQLCFASNGVEGLAAASRELPDLIILDVTMPVMDGVECLMKLKSDSALRDIPVIMLTAEAGKENVLKIAKMGVRDYIVKPFTEQLLLERVSRVIELKPKGSETKRIKTINDPATLLVIDEHQTIIDTIQRAVAHMPWKVLGTDQCGEAAQLIAKEPPDIVLISLSLPNKAALNFFHLLRSNVRSQNMPVMGLSVKTAQEEQTEAKNAGFTGIITKPIDTTELADRLARAMNLDTSGRYYREENGILFIKFPKGLSQNGALDLAQYIEPKTKALVEAGMNRAILDLTDLDRLEIYIIKLIVQVLNSCRELDIKYRIVGSPEFINQAKAYEETSDMKIYPSLAEALADFS
ncbi:MAG: response regulator [Chthoniobacterales bacterium]|nr:response regulator [Chthoniobacterales bacterium]